MRDEFSGSQIPQQNAKAPNIERSVQLTLFEMGLQMLRRRVACGAPLSDRDGGFGLFAGLVKIADQQPSVPCDQHVFRFEVTVDDWKPCEMCMQIN